MRKTVILTGAAGGLGSATAHRLAKSGYDLIITDIFEPKNLAEELGSYDIEVKALRINVADEQSIFSLVKEIQMTKGLYGLVTMAGITRDRTIKKISMEEWDTVLDINLKGTYLMIKHVGPLLQGGSIVTIGSVVSKFGNFGQVNYVASKAGVEGISKVAAREYAKQNIRVNCILPGFIQTPMTDKIPVKGIQSIVNQIPLARMGQPSEIADVVEFLISDKSSYITGSSIHVNGGLWMG
ncbi:MAG: SDR family oxidoreductase [Candidatus Heimdallarchaeota archaeon]|nr:SDR family oxidoreductase [Candidatus Heimdallarchaeota archaeon]